MAATAIIGVLPTVVPAVFQGRNQWSDASKVGVVSELVSAQQCVYGVMEVVAPLGIEIVSTLAGGAKDARIIQITLCDQLHRFPQPLGQIGNRRLEFCQEMACSEIEYSMHSVQAQRVEVIVLKPVECVFNKESPHFIAAHTVEIESLAPGRSIVIGKVRSEGI